MPVKQFNSQSCDARDWCAAMTIDSLSEDPVAGTTLKPTCTSEILGGTEYVNFAFLTHSYNVAFDEEIGHFDYCTTAGNTGTCSGTEGAPGDQEATDGDDTSCFPASASLLVQVTGCNGTNVPGWDGTSYQPVWPDGNTSLHPTPELFSSPLTGRSFTGRRSEAAGQRTPLQRQIQL